MVSHLDESSGDSSIDMCLFIPITKVTSARPHLALIIPRNIDTLTFVSTTSLRVFAEEAILWVVAEHTSRDILATD